MSLRHKGHLTESLHLSIYDGKCNTPIRNPDPIRITLFLLMIEPDNSYGIGIEDRKMTRINPVGYEEALLRCRIDSLECHTLSRAFKDKLPLIGQVPIKQGNS